MKKLLIPVCLLAAVTCSRAQNQIDALRYSQLTFGSTARSMAMGGAFGALGGDLSTLGINPAGIGTYVRSEFSFTPNVFKGETVSSFYGNKTSDSRYNFGFNSAGVVYTYDLKESPDEKGWKSWNFGIGYNRFANFNSHTFYEGGNPDNSLLDRYLQDVNPGGGINPSNLSDNYHYGAWLAYQTYLIDTIPGDTSHYYSAVPFAGTQQRRTSSTRGGMGEIDLTFGGNYNDKIYIGFTIGLPTIRYREEVTYSEADHKDTIYDFKSFSYAQSLLTTGAGFNFKFGMIVRPTDWLRLGGAVHSPSFFTMNDEYSASMRSTFDNGESFKEDSDPGLYDYQLNTPFRAIGSAAVIFGKKGLITADYEFVDYPGARFRQGSAFVDENNAIQSQYREAANLRLGAEWKYEAFSFRGGYAWYGSPFEKGLNTRDSDRRQTSYTAGIGIRENNYFLDFSYIFTKYGEFFRAYSLNNEEVEGTVNTVYNYRFMMTMGVKF